MKLRFADPSSDSLPIHLIAEDARDQAIAELPDTARAWSAAHAFQGSLGQSLVLPGPSGHPNGALIGTGTTTTRARKRFAVGAAIAKLPPGLYRLSKQADQAMLYEIALGYLLSLYRFDRYRTAPAQLARLSRPEGIDCDRLERVVQGEALTRDLINAPAEQMGPDQLAAEVSQLAARHGAQVEVITGDALLEKGFPLVHAVGRAAQQAPRLIELHWGNTGPALTLVGKGVCFDTGGLNLKPGNSMGLMKKDMGGAATVLGLAEMIMTAQHAMRLRVLIPAVENAIGPGAFRPGDILTARNGQTIEVNNTDAEGRLVLADALAYAAETTSDLTISMATLTGAARVALGPDLAPFYTDDDPLAAALMRAGREVLDPTWRMPFHPAYESWIEPGIADLDNAPSGGFAGSITAALFLRRFASSNTRFAHFDIYGWQPTALPGRPIGGTGQGARAIYECLPECLDERI